VSQQERTLPFNIDVEQALIGAVLLNNDAFMKVSAIVATEHFHEEMHQAIWSTIAAIIGKGQVATPVTLKTYLGNPEFGEGKTLLSYMTGLATSATTVMNAPSYARTVRDLHLRRELVAMSERLASIAYEAPVEATAETIFAESERALEALRPSVQKDDEGFYSFDDISTAEVHEAYKEQRGIVGMSTGLPRLDEVLNGLQNSDVIVVAGRPGMGKSALASNIAVSAARYLKSRAEAGDEPGVVGFSSLEMSGAQIKHRIISDMASVSAKKLLKGLATAEEMQAFVDAERDLRGLPLQIDQTGGLSIGQVKMRARALKKRRGLKLLVIDYLQLLSGNERKGRDVNRTQEVTEITTGLKALAKELNIPIIALSQLSRDVEKRDDKRPMLADLRESGSIEQDADAVVFIYREEYYLRNAKPREEGEALGHWYAKMNKWEGVAEVHVAKNRHGSTGTVELGFVGEFTRFTPEPPHRFADPEEARTKKVTLTDHGMALREILRELSSVFGTRPTIADIEAKPGLPPNAMLIPRDEAKKVFFERVVADLPPAEGARKLQAASDNLRRHKLTESFNNSEGTKVVYLVELIAE
jgi:replicative DNA helicase